VEPVVYLNGAFVPYSQAVVPVEDRGYQFGDGVYEVVRCYGGHPFEADAHWERLERSAAALGIELPLTRAELTGLALELCRRNGLREAGLYVQVTRGVATRNHLPPPGMRPTVVAIAREARAPSAEQVERGLHCITLPDTRWLHNDIKSVALLGAVLGRLKASAAGADDALFIRDGCLTEATAANAHLVLGGTVVTHPANHLILNGITRRVMLRLAGQLGIPVEERPAAEAELRRADEIFISGTVTELLPVTRLDGQPVSGGRPGPVFRRLYQAMAEHVETFRARAAAASG